MTAPGLGDHGPAAASNDAQFSFGPAPSIAVPSGGGTLRSMGDHFAMNHATGTGTYTIPIAVTPGRAAAETAFSLSYSSGGGNGIFGLGWSHSFDMSVSRKCDSSLPQYLDEESPDTFVLTGFGELVPCFEGTATNYQHVHVQADDKYVVKQYRPRLERSFARIEWWTRIDELHDTHWRVFSPENELSVYGRDEESRVIGRDECGIRTFSWLLCEQYDCMGNARRLIYKPEDSANVDTYQACEQNRTKDSRSRLRYLKRVLYGNRKPIYLTSTEPAPPAEFMFEIAFDYGEHDPSHPTPQQQKPWPVRQDPFSTYRSGFELRCYRQCRRILMFHHFPEELRRADYLVHATALSYDDSPHASHLLSLQHVGFIATGLTHGTSKDVQGGHDTASLPPVQFEYTSTLTAQRLSDAPVQNSHERQSFENFAAAGAASSMWLDLLGEGIPGVLASEGGEWFYKPNLSPVRNEVSSTRDHSKRPELRLGPLSVVSPRPLQHGPGMTLADVGANGSLDLVCSDGTMHGFYRSRANLQDRAQDSVGWDDYQPFTSIQNFDRADFTRFVDLTGDGNADVLTFLDSQLVWYPSLGETGYGSARHVVFDNESAHPSSFLMQDGQSIHLADMSGDGLVDLVCIRNNTVLYWPNLGYGRFGREVHMDCCPQFDNDTAFSSARLFLCDIDGSGTTDLIYNRNGVVSIHLNSSGNKFEEPVLLSTELPHTQNHSLGAVDLFGNGTACLVWSTDLPSHQGPASFQYIDLTNGVKPHLLCKVANGMGSLTTFEYCPSTSYYCKDKLDGKPWATKLPFPVHCIASVTRRDLTTNRKFVQRFSYHHGTYDHIEREFAGFAMVEQWDADVPESFTEDENDQRSGTELDSQPAHVKTWYHTGVFTDHDALTGMLVKEYYGSDNTPGFYDSLLHDSIGNSEGEGDLTMEESRQVTYALRGTILRQEISADLPGPQQSIPFTITDRCSHVKILQRHFEAGSPIVAFVGQRESKVTTLERQQIIAARVAHNVVIERDEYGRAIKEAQIQYGRSSSDGDLSTVDQSYQSTTRIRYSTTTFTNSVDLPGRAYRLPKPLKIVAFEIEISNPLSGHYKLADIPVPTSSQRISETRIQYRTDDFASLSDKLGAQALPGAIFRLCMTQKDIEAFQLPAGTLDPQSLRGMLIADGKYVDLMQDGELWIKQLAPTYHPDAIASPAEERKLAQSSFFSICRVTDAFGNATVIDWDPYFMAPKTLTDAEGSRTTGLLDYRVLQMQTVIDINGNKNSVLFDALGGVTALASSGKKKEGDSIDEIGPQPSRKEIDDFFAQPILYARALLGKASRRFINDPWASSATPVRVAQISREKHASESSESRLMIQIQYLDGTGRLLQTKDLAESERTTPNVERWRCSAWNMVNNKGLVIERFEPFLDASAAFVPFQKHGVSTLHVYDALDREVITIMPNATWTKTELTPWSSVQYDASDTLELPLTMEPSVSLALQSVIKSRYPASWLQQRSNLPETNKEKQAATQSRAYGCTPVSTYLDSRARPFLQQKMLLNGTRTYVRTIFDHDAQPLQIQDTGDRIVSICRFDKLGRQMYQQSIDSGDHWALFAASGEPLQQYDARGYRLRYTYDSLRRNIAVFCRNFERDTTEYMMTQTMYGEDDTFNARGKVVKHMDQSGVTSTPFWDMNGNPLLTEVRLTEHYTQDIDWQRPVKLESKRYTTAMKYDALGRITSSIAPDDSVTRTTYLTGGLVDETCLNIRSEKDAKGWKWRVVSARKQYNAYGVLTSEERGNGIFVNFEFDKFTQQMSRRKVSKAGVIVQDIQYTRDVNHDVVYVSRDSQLPDISRLQGSADSAYEYDGLGRLVKASGREDVGITKGRPDAPGNVIAGSIATGMKRFEETYTYDEHDNMTILDHKIDDAKSAGWSRKMAYGTQTMGTRTFTGNRLVSSSMGKLNEAYTYDKSGNMISMPHMSKVVWDVSNRMRSSAVQVTTSGVPETTWYVYNSAGQRVRKITERSRESATETARKLSEHVYVDDYDLYQEYSGLGNVQKSCESVRVDEDDSPTVIVEHWSHLSKPLMRFQFKNEQESVSLELDEKGENISYEEFSAFGSTTYSRSTKDAPKPFRYATKRRDKETGLAYFGGRYYVPWLCRWMSADPSGLVDGTNTYIYCGANPTNYTDPDGNMLRNMGHFGTSMTLGGRPAPLNIPRTSMNHQQSASYSTSTTSSAMIPAQERRLALPPERRLMRLPERRLMPLPERRLTVYLPKTSPMAPVQTTSRQESPKSSSPNASAGTQVAKTEEDSNVLSFVGALLTAYEVIRGVYNERQRQREETSDSGTPQEQRDNTTVAAIWELSTTAVIRMFTNKLTAAIRVALSAKDTFLGAANLAAMGGASFGALAHNAKDVFAQKQLPEGATRFSSGRDSAENAGTAARMKNNRAEVAAYGASKVAGMVGNALVRSPPQSGQ
ncbi:hypothetical protein BST61_g9551 [Cercospora zeina]